MRIFIYGLIFTCSFTSLVFGEVANLLPNGTVENEFLNLMTEGSGFTASIKAKDTFVATYWQLSGAASMRKDVAYQGNACIQLQGGEKSASATTFSDYWRVKDPDMPFGLPLMPNRDVHVSFYYKTSAGLQNDILSAEITLGTIANLPSDNKKLALEASSEWKRVKTTLRPKEIRWGAKIVFTLAPNSGTDDLVLIDDVSLIQDLGDPLNLLHNPSFEEKCKNEMWPDGWIDPMEDQWVSWVGDKYRAPYS